MGSASFELYTCSVSSTHARTLLTASGQPAHTRGRGAISWWQYPTRGSIQRAAVELLIGISKRAVRAPCTVWQHPARGGIQCVAVSNVRLWSYELASPSEAMRARCTSHAWQYPSRGSIQRVAVSNAWQYPMRGSIRCAAVQLRAGCGATNWRLQVRCARTLSPHAPALSSRLARKPTVRRKTDGCVETNDPFGVVPGLRSQPLVKS